MNPADIQEHYRSIRHVLLRVLILNWLVALGKIVFGIFTSCASITADGFHSLSDGASNIIGIAGINLACQPTDSDHPYGHRKYETFFSLGIALLLFLIAIALVHTGIERLRTPAVPTVDIRSFLIMIITMGINTLVTRYEHKKAKLLRSDILHSDAMHTKADILTSITVIIALVVIKLGYPILDPIATIVISFFIARSGYVIVKESSLVLCDHAAILDVKKIENVVLAQKGVKACHKIRSRGRPDDIHLDLHVQVSPDMHIEIAHKISYSIEEAIKKAVPEVSDVIVHMEPKESP